MNPPNIGGVDNFQMMEDAKVRTLIKDGLVISTADKFYLAEFPQSEVAIVAIYYRGTVLTAGAALLEIGTDDGGDANPADPDDVANLVVPTVTIEGALLTFDLKDTLVRARPAASRGRPIIKKGHALYLEVDGVPTAGTCSIIIQWYPLDGSVR